MGNDFKQTLGIAALLVGIVVLGLLLRDPMMPAPPYSSQLKIDMRPPENCEPNINVGIVFCRGLLESYIENTNDFPINVIKMRSNPVFYGGMFSHNILYVHEWSDVINPRMRLPDIFISGDMFLIFNIVEKTFLGSVKLGPAIPEDRSFD